MLLLWLTSVIKGSSFVFGLFFTRYFLLLGQGVNKSFLFGLLLGVVTSVFFIFISLFGIYRQFGIHQDETGLRDIVFESLTSGTVMSIVGVAIAMVAFSIKSIRGGGLRVANDDQETINGFSRFNSGSLIVSVLALSYFWMVSAPDDFKDCMNNGLERTTKAGLEHKRNDCFKQFPVLGRVVDGKTDRLACVGVHSNKVVTLSIDKKPMIDRLPLVLVSRTPQQVVFKPDNTHKNIITDAKLTLDPLRGELKINVSYPSSRETYSCKSDT